MFIISFVLLPKRTTRSIIITTFIYPIFIKLTSFMPMIDSSHYYLFWIMLSGIISGITTGGILKIGCSTGGVNVLIILLKKYYKIPEYKKMNLVIEEMPGSSLIIQNTLQLLLLINSSNM